MTDTLRRLQRLRRWLTALNAALVTWFVWFAGREAYRHSWGWMCFDTAFALLAARELTLNLRVIGTWEVRTRGLRTRRDR